MEGLFALIFWVAVCCAAWQGIKAWLKDKPPAKSPAPVARRKPSSPPAPRPPNTAPKGRRKGKLNENGATAAGSTGSSAAHQIPGQDIGGASQPTHHHTHHSGSGSSHSAGHHTVHHDGGGGHDGGHCDGGAF